MNYMEKQEVNFYTDGGCSGNPGPGGYGVVCLDGKDILYAISYQEEFTTNNRMELKAILNVFKNFKDREDLNITLYSDSAYCVNMLNDWIWKWALNDWCNSKGKEVENIDLVQEAYKLLKSTTNIRIVHVKGHNGLVGNELADALATNNMVKYKTLVKKNALEEDYRFSYVEDPTWSFIQSVDDREA